MSYAKRGAPYGAPLPLLSRDIPSSETSAGQPSDQDGAYHSLPSEVFLSVVLGGDQPVFQLEGCDSSIGCLVHILRGSGTSTTTSGFRLNLILPPIDCVQGRRSLRCDFHGRGSPATTPPPLCGGFAQAA